MSRAVARDDRDGRTRRLWAVLGLNVAMVVVVLAVGTTARSLGVLAEGGDYLADAAGIGVPLYVVRSDNEDGDGGEDLGMRAALLDTAPDAATAAGVAISGAVILVSHGAYWLGPAVALAIAMVIGFHAARLLWQVRCELRGDQR